MPNSVNPTLFRAFPVESLKYSAEEEGDSSGVSRRTWFVEVVLKPLLGEAFAVFSLGGVGGRAAIGISPGAKPAMVDLVHANFH